MAKIFRSIISIDNAIIAGEATANATNYWGDLKNERWFPIPFWQAKQLLSASGSDTIALRVVNIDDLFSVSAKWMVFEEALADSLEDPNESGNYYFIITDEFFNDLAQEHPSENNLIRGRIGQDSNGNYYAYFQVAECKLIDDGAGGGGALSGGRVPSNQ